jgi:hypothetical protein
MSEQSEADLRMDSATDGVFNGVFRRYDIYEGWVYYGVHGTDDSELRSAGALRIIHFRPLALCEPAETALLIDQIYISLSCDLR